MEGGEGDLNPHALAVQFTLDNIVAEVLAIEEDEEKIVFLRKEWAKLSSLAQYQLFSFAIFDLAAAREKALDTED